MLIKQHFESYFLLNILTASLLVHKYNSTTSFKWLPGISSYEIKAGYLGYFQILAFTTSTIMKIFIFIKKIELKKYFKDILL